MLDRREILASLAAGALAQGAARAAEGDDFYVGKTSSPAEWLSTMP